METTDEGQGCGTEGLAVYVTRTKITVANADHTATKTFSASTTNKNNKKNVVNATCKLDLFRAVDVLQSLMFEYGLNSVTTGIFGSFCSLCVRPPHVLRGWWPVTHEAGNASN